MSVTEAVMENKSVGKCLLDNWVEERATAALDNSVPRVHIHKSGHTGILTMDMSSGERRSSTMKVSFTPPKGPKERQRGLRGELLEKFLFKTISEQVIAEFNPEPPVSELCSTAKSDYTAEGWQPVPFTPSMEHDYKAEQAITFWRDNHQKIQGVTAVRTHDTPFKKNATFSTPLSLHLDEPVVESDPAL